MRRAATIGLAISALTALAACGGGGGDGGGSTSPPLAEPQASEAVAAAVLSAASVVVELAADPPAAEDVGRGTTGVAIARASCPGGGSLSGTCVLRHSGSTVRSVLRHCQLVDEATGLHVTVDGRLTVQTPYNVCESSGFRSAPCARIGSTTSAPSSATARASSRRSLPNDLLRPSCRSRGMREGRCDARSRRRVGGAAPRRRQRRATRSRPAPRAARQRIGWSVRPAHRGERSADDRRPFGVAPQRGRLDGLAVEVDADGGMRRVDGGFALDCVPAFTIATDEPLAPGDVCPAAGALTLQRADESRGTIRFVDGGVRIDADADGTPERVAADCRAPALAQCPL